MFLFVSNGIKNLFHISFKFWKFPRTFLNRLKNSYTQWKKNFHVFEDISFSYTCSNKLTRWNVKNYCTRPKKPIRSIEKKFLYLSEKLIFTKHYILDVFDRGLNTPPPFIFALCFFFSAHFS